MYPKITKMFAGGKRSTLVCCDVAVVALTASRSVPGSVLTVGWGRRESYKSGADAVWEGVYSVCSDSSEYRARSKRCLGYTALDR